MAPPNSTIRWLCGSYRLLAKRLESLEMTMQTKDQGYQFSTKDIDATPFSPSRPPGVHHRADVQLAEALVRTASQFNADAVEFVPPFE